MVSASVIHIPGVMDTKKKVGIKSVKTEESIMSNQLLKFKNKAGIYRIYLKNESSFIESRPMCQPVI